MNIPAVILEMEEYRKKILIGGTSLPPKGEKVEEITQVIDELESVSFLELPSVRERTNHAFTWVFENFGYDEFRKMAIKMKKIDGISSDQYAEAKGELAELFLYITVKEWLRINNKYDWKVYHHFYLPYKSGNGSTELDVVIASQYIIVVFECKSYNGAKILTRECMLTPARSKAIDVFKQNALHCKALWEHVEPFALSDVGVLKSAYFNFSLGTLTDKRSDDNKRLMPALSEDNIIHFLNAMNKSVNRVGWRSSILAFTEDIGRREYNAEEHVSSIKERHG